MNKRRRKVHGGGGAWLLMLALVWMTSSGCTFWPDSPWSGSQAQRNPEPQARDAAAAVANSSEVFQPQDTSDLYDIFARRQAAGVDHPAHRGRTNDPHHRLFAVLVNGGEEGYHQTNVLNAAEALKQLEVDTKNIFILSTGVPWMNIAAYDPAETPFLVIAKPTATNFKLVLDYLGSVVTSNDVVLLYVTGHGGKEDEAQTLGVTGLPAWPPQPGETSLSTIALKGASVTALELKHQLEQLQRQGYPLIVFLSDECYGGGLARTVKGHGGALYRHVHHG